MKILGVSGSPIKNSNTDRALKAVLEATGMEAEFIKLTDFTVAPCMACLGCVETNKCVIEDDGILLAEKAKRADALVIAGFTPYSTLDSRTKAFIERLYPLRHNHGFMAGKPGGAVITCAIPEESEMLPPACEMGVKAIQFYMMEEGMNFVGAFYATRSASKMFIRGARKDSAPPRQGPSTQLTTSHPPRSARSNRN